ncbi:ATP-binding cassette domain-containing protein [Bacillus mycoides]|uniref:ABC transporter ATP-binding protein n=2 Tax=Bacillaceae TaxID=186817 RepID=UPI001F08CFFA|nr:MULTISPECIES: ATP-binding cassette domain-containing protein [Bacillus]MED1270490.1 ATP-binding cassette domain-containing protein [Bacillus mycoides]MED1287369.1 ATP-binding cassette domain-containing protein [Bacillus mycoides]
MSVLIIEAKNLSREFTVYSKENGSFFMLNQILGRKGTKKKVVDNINMDIAEGEMVGYLGPNGAGKSTTIKMLSGVLTPTSGELKVLGREPGKYRKENAKDIGVLYGQRTQLWWDLKLKDSFELLKAIYKVDSKVYKKRLDNFIEILDMEEFINRPVRQLSLGQRMRGEMVATLLHSPPILFLDEPTIGLDVLAKNKIQEFLKFLNKEEKTTVLITSHNMDDIEKLCDRIVLIDQGKIMFDGAKNNLKKMTTKKDTLIVEIALEDMNKIPSLIPLKKEDNKMYFEFSDHEEVPKIINELSKQFRLIKIEIETPEIEQVLRELYENKQYGMVL